MVTLIHGTSFIQAIIYRCNFLYYSNRVSDSAILLKLLTIYSIISVRCLIIARHFIITRCFADTSKSVKAI